MAIIDSIEYSVCEDCLFCVAYGLSESAPDEHEQAFDEGCKREIGDKNGHFSTGVAPTEDDPDGNGYDSFSRQECELCRSTLGGSRHGVTLLITGEA